MEWTTAVSGPDVVRTVAVDGRRPVRRSARRRTRQSSGAHRRARAADRPATSGSPFFSRSLAALGRDDLEQRRARLYAVIEDVIADAPQGFAHDEANIRHLCGLAGVSRAGYYRRRGPHWDARDDADLRDLIHRIALADRHYGYRRVKRELLRQGVVVNHKRVRRLMREDNLLACASNRSFRAPR